MSENKQRTLYRLHCALSERLAEIQTLFKGEVGVTLIVRTPEVQDGGVLLTNETNIEDAIAEIQRLRDKPPIS